MRDAPAREQESTLEAGREREEALQQLEQERAQLQAVAQSQDRMAQQLDALGQELAATRQQLQQSQASPCSLMPCRLLSSLSRWSESRPVLFPVCTTASCHMLLIPLHESMIALYSPGCEKT